MCVSQVSPPSLDDVETALASTGLLSPEELYAVMTHHPYYTYYSLAEAQTDTVCFARRASGGGVAAPTRPLAEKLSALLDYMFTSLCVSWDVPDTDRLIDKLNHVAVSLMAQK